MVDDGSTDDGPSVVQGCTDKRVRLIRQANRGPGAARNRGIQESNSPYLTFLDADDEWHPDFLRCALHVLNSHEIFLSDFFIGEGNQTYMNTYPEVAGPCGLFTLPYKMKPAKVKRYIDLFTQGNVVIGKQVAQRMGGYYEEGCTYGEDSFFWLKVMLNYSFFIYPKPLMRLHHDSSELSHGRKGHYPVHPFVSNHSTILQFCPDKYKKLAKRVLDYYALLNVWRCLDRLDFSSAHDLMCDFPYTKRYIYQFQKAKLKRLMLSFFQTLNN